MNYLAHLLLAEPTAEGWLGGLMGDFVKGTVDARLAPAVQRGIRLHRRIDAFTDAHTVHRRSRDRIGPPRRRFAGIIIDVCYDHFLAISWHRHADEPLDRFVGRVYAVLAEHEAELPERLRRIAPRMAEQDWLGSYRDLETVGLALDGIATRSPRIAPLAGAIEDVRTSYRELSRDFDQFFPELVAHAEAFKASQRTSIGT